MFFKEFIKGTSSFSRFLLFLWIMEIAGILMYDTDHLAFSLVMSCIFSSAPIAMIELCSNPVVNSQCSVNTESGLSKFLLLTKRISRVLVILWLYLCMLIALTGRNGYPLISFVVVTVLLLMPALLIEKRCNPVWRGDGQTTGEESEKSKELLKAK